LQRKSIDANAARIEDLYQRSRTFMIVFGLVVLALGAVRMASDARHYGAAEPGGGYRRGRGEQGPDHAYRSHQQDETGRLLQALQQMNDGLISIVTEVRNGTESISTASSQIAAGNLDLSGRTEEQASSLEETASSMEELTRP
jgi:methyl-accepting chemotaxis protein